jgi:lipopolysaccharide/colanic/teichoic acid biosynthesis glycosyltransferase
MDKIAMELAQCDGMNCFERAIKRSFDFIGSFLAIIILSPLFLVIYIALLCQGDGSVIFKQERIGYKGKPFISISSGACEWMLRPIRLNCMWMGMNA